MSRGRGPIEGAEAQVSRGRGPIKGADAQVQVFSERGPIKGLRPSRQVQSNLVSFGLEAGATHKAGEELQGQARALSQLKRQSSPMLLVVLGAIASSAVGLRLLSRPCYHA